MNYISHPTAAPHPTQKIPTECAARRGPFCIYSYGFQEENHQKKIQSTVVQLQIYYKFKFYNCFSGKSSKN